jgi:hypothetical protein
MTAEGHLLMILPAAGATNLSLKDGLDGATQGLQQIQSCKETHTSTKDIIIHGWKRTELNRRLHSSRGEESFSRV